MSQTQDFRRSVEKTNKLSAILCNPVFMEAVELVMQGVEPRIPQSPTQESTSLLYNYSAGVHGFRRALRTLATRITQEPDDELPDPFAALVGGKLLTPSEIERKVQRKKNKPDQP